MRDAIDTDTIPAGAVMFQLEGANDCVSPVCGRWILKFPDPGKQDPLRTYMGEEYKIIASDGMAWDHVSVSGRFIPSWAVMAAVKEMFFWPEEVAMQLHPARSEYVNHHPTCLHIWRPQDLVVPTPPTLLVGPVTG